MHNFQFTFLCTIAMNKKVLYHFNQLYEFDENLTNPLTQRIIRAIIYVRSGKPQKKK